MRKMSKSLLNTIGIYAIGVVLSFCIQYCYGHGRLIEPPSRASAWRYGFQTPPDYNDHELYCGGFTRQWKQNGGKCGVCGDAWDLAEPRPHENGGHWGQGVIVRKYKPGTEMTLRVELTASHMGYFEFRICPEPNGKQECFDKHLLEIMGGNPSILAPGDLNTRFYPRNGSRIYEIKALLPDMKCDQCVVQWRYVAGNNWGMCPDGNGAVGCGPQEEFRSCSDIALGEGAYTPIRPFRPTTTRPKVTSPVTDTTQYDKESEGTHRTLVFIIISIFLFVFCSLAIWYLYRYQNQRLKGWISTVENRFCKKQNSNTTLTASQSSSSRMSFGGVFITPLSTSKINENASSDYPPVPPPRTKRLSRVKEITANESSIS